MQQSLKLHVERARQVIPYLLRRAPQGTVHARWLHRGVLGAGSQTPLAWSGSKRTYHIGTPVGSVTKLGSMGWQGPGEAAAAAACHALVDRSLRRTLKTQAQSSQAAATAGVSAAQVLPVLMHGHILGEGVVMRQPHCKRHDTKMLQTAWQLQTG